LKVQTHCKLGFVKLLVSFLFRLTQSNSVTSGREQRQELDLKYGLLELVPASNPAFLAGSWVKAAGSTQADAVSQSGQYFSDH